MVNNDEIVHVNVLVLKTNDFIIWWSSYDGQCATIVEGSCFRDASDFPCPLPQWFCNAITLRSNLTKSILHWVSFIKTAYNAFPHRENFYETDPLCTAVYYIREKFIAGITVHVRRMYKCAIPFSITPPPPSVHRDGNIRAYETMRGSKYTWWHSKTK